MMEAAVQSAGNRLHIYCILSGNTSKHHNVVRFLNSYNVTIIHHVPIWSDAFWAKVKPHRTANLRHSHLYKSKETVVGTWQRIDIPTLHILKQYHHVLFTDTDVFFRKSIAFIDFNVLPDYVSMAPEMSDMFPYNAGVMLMNLYNLSVSYNKFFAFIMSNNFGLYFPDYGPGDQGAYNQFYEKGLRSSVLSKNFNAKPYQTFLESSSIVHFHGPKPHEYLQFFKSGVCLFGTMCEAGFQQSFCQYLHDWNKFCPTGGPACVRLRLMCAVAGRSCP